MSTPENDEDDLHLAASELADHIDLVDAEVDRMCTPAYLDEAYERITGHRRPGAADDGSAG